MMFRAPSGAARPRTLPSAPSLRQRLGPLLLVSLAAAACTKEAPREPPPRAEEPAVAPAPETSAPAPPRPAEPADEPHQQMLRQDESNDATDFGVGAGQAAPAKPAAPASKPAAKSRPPASSPAPPPRASRAAEAEKDDSASPEALRRELSRAVELSTPDCPSARERKQAICDLAAQLCQLVDRDPDVASVESYCADARQRCSEAQRRTAERCPR